MGWEDKANGVMVLLGKEEIVGKINGKTELSRFD